MKKLKSSLTNMAVVLTCIAVVAGGALAYVNAVTAPQIEKINQENLENGIKKVMGSDNISVAEPVTRKAEVNGKEREFTIYPVSDATGKALGNAVKSTANGFGGTLEVLTGFSPDGTILGYTILQSAETPGLGAKANLWFQKENGEKRTIVGKNPGKCNFTVSKDGGDIDAITASTITSRAFLSAVKSAYDQLVNTNDNADADSGASRQAKK